MVKKNQLSVSSHLMGLIEEGKTRFMYLQDCPSKSANVTLGKRKKKGGDGIRETYFTEGKAILILITRVRVIHVFYT